MWATASSVRPSRQTASQVSALADAALADRFSAIPARAADLALHPMAAWNESETQGTNVGFQAVEIEGESSLFKPAAAAQQLLFCRAQAPTSPSVGMHG